MKYNATVWRLVSNTPVTIFIGLLLIAAALWAQNQFAVTTPPGAVTGCPTPVAGMNILCSVTDGYYASISGAAYQPINATAGGVTSFNKRTGAVLPVVGDYSYSQLSSPPTTIACTTSSQSNTGLSASGCVIK